MDAGKPERRKSRNSEKRQRNKQSKIRWLDDEFNTAAAKAQASGLSFSAYVRAAATGSPGPRAQRALPIDAELLRQVLAALGRYGNNLNQIAYKLNTGAAPFKMQDDVDQALVHVHEIINLGLEAFGKKPHRA